MEAQPIVPVILSGGAGTRLWPLSRAEAPKQLIDLVGGPTLLQRAALRTAGDVGAFGPPIVVASARHADAIEAQLDAVGVKPDCLILEPVARNTAMAIALAASAIAPSALMLVLPSDQMIGDEQAFRQAVLRAGPIAAGDMLVTFGITPDRPATGYGYIERGEALGEDLYRATAFVEKPDLARAETYVAAGRHVWNAGIFLMRAGACVDALDEHASDILAAARAAIAAARREGTRLHPDEATLAAAPSLPFDIAVMEKASRVAVAPVAMDWSDVGSWDSLYAIGARDEAGNVASGPVQAIDANGCLLKSDGPELIAIGVEDLIVVAAEGAMLVVRRGESEKVREALLAIAAKRSEQG